MILNQINFRYSFCHGFNCGTAVGYAKVGAMCNKDACAVVQDVGRNTGYTIAHELGHV